MDCNAWSDAHRDEDTYADEKHRAFGICETPSCYEKDHKQINFGGATPLTHHLGSLRQVSPQPRSHASLTAKPDLNLATFFSFPLLGHQLCPKQDPASRYRLVFAEASPDASVISPRAAHLAISTLRYCAPALACSTGGPCALIRSPQ